MWETMAIPVTAQRMMVSQKTAVMDIRAAWWIFLVLFSLAAAMGADLEVEVLLDEHVPKSVRLRGAISPGAKASLNAWIQENFSISPEDLQWN